MQINNSTPSISSGDTRSIAANLLAARVVAEGLPFLRRNVKASLDDNEERVRDSQPPLQSQSNGFTLSRPTIRNHFNRASWKPPAPKMVNYLVEKTKKRLKINVKGLKPTNAKSSTATDSMEPAGSTRKRRKVVDCRARIDLTFYELKMVETDKGQRLKRAGGPILKTNGDAQFHGRLCDDSNYHFDIEQTNGFVVETSQLMSPRGPQSEMRLPDRYEATISLTLLNQEAARETLGLIGGEIPVSGPMEPLVASWTDFPKCPLPRAKALRASQMFSNQGKDKKKRKTDYGFVVEMAWSQDSSLKTNSDSMLATHNILKRKQAAASLPTPVSTPGAETQPQSPHSRSRSIQLEYVFSGNRKATTTGYRCLLCSGEKGLEHPSLDRLRLHFDTWHSNHHESFLITQTGSKVKILVETEERGRGARVKKTIIPQLWEPGYDEFFRVTKPFDIKKAIREIETAATTTSDEYMAETEVPVLQHRVETGTRIRTKRVEDVAKWLPPRQKRRFIVPPNPPDKNGKPGRYVSSTSKRFLVPGEVLSESDDEYPMEWFRLSSNNKIDRRKDITESAKVFYKSIDTHLESERLSGDFYLGDAIVRWLQKPSSQELLVEEEGRECFHEWLKVVERFINPEVFTFAIEAGNMIKVSSNWQGRRPMQNTIPDSIDGDEEPSAIGGADLGVFDPATYDNGMPRQLKHCKCGELACFTSECISCVNMDCQYPDYHRECVGLTYYQKGWLCEKCRTSDV